VQPPIPHLEGVTHRDVQVRGVSFHVAEAGDGPPVLLLHGWPQHWFCWRKLVPLLADDHRLICPDLRGFGWSQAPAGAYDKQTLAHDMVGLLDALELERVDLIAHDWGAWAGFLMCLGHPQRFAHYLALNMYTPWVAPPSVTGTLGLWRLWYQVAIATPGLGRLLISRTDFVRRLITAGAVHADAWSEEELESFSAVLREPARTSASIGLYRTFLLRELGPYLAGRNRDDRLTVPTLLLHGTRDLAIDHRRLGDWRAHADRMTVELRDDSGHFIAEELPGVVADHARALFGS
jgi:pimeloyl-ACP methyl ester carboxylesterase